MPAFPDLLEANGIAILGENLRNLLDVETIAGLKERAVRRVEVRLAGPPTGWEALHSLPGVRDVSLDDGVLRLSVEGAMDAVVKELARLPIQTLTSAPPDLEEIFLSYYGSGDAD